MYTLPSPEGEDPGEVRGSLEDRVCWQGAEVLPRYAFPAEGPGTSWDTIYLWQCCLPCSVSPPNGELSPPFLSPGQLARKSKALRLTQLTSATSCSLRLLGHLVSQLPYQLVPQEPEGRTDAMAT